MKKQLQKLTLLLLIFGTFLFSAEIPSRILLNLTENPATEMAVTWRTCNQSENPLAEIVVSNPTTKFEDNIKQFTAKEEKLTLENGETVYHYSVIMNSLEPKTLYAYRVGAADAWSEWNHFETATKEFEPFEFVYFGDVQTGIFDMSSRVLRKAYQKAPEAKYWFFAGDIINHGDNDSEMGEFFDAMGWIPRTTPMVFTPGNHEYPYKQIGDKKERQLSILWHPHYTLPENGIEGLEETNYYIDYQGVKFISLNGTKKLEEQAKWLKKLLKKNKEKWTFVTVHQPFYSTASGRDSQERRDLFLPIFDKYGVDMVLQGHDHAYGRTYKMRDNQVVAADEPGTYYAVSVVGTKVYTMKEENRKIMAKMDTGKQLFQIITVEKNKLIYKSYTALGELFDHFEIIK